MDERERRIKIDRVTAIAEALIAGQIEHGQLDPENAETMEKAIKIAIRDAAKAYDAALEFVSG